VTHMAIRGGYLARGRGLLERFGLAMAFGMICLAISLSSDRFLTPNNITNILRQSTINGIISVGMTLVILTRGIDLSVGSVLALSTVVTASLLHLGISVPVATLIGLTIGGTLGLVNGVLVTRLKVPPFIATLGMMTLARGLALTYTFGKPVTGLAEAFRFIGTGYLGPIPMPIVVAALVFILGHIALSRTSFGVFIYGIGNNETAARLAGINVEKHVTLVYVITGALSALAGMILVARLDSAQPVAGLGFEFDAIAAVVVGGTSFDGGKGSLLGTLLGVLIIAVINNGMNLLDVPTFYQGVVKGVVIALALLVRKGLR